MTNYEMIQEMEPYQLAGFLRKVSDGEKNISQLQPSVLGGELKRYI